MTIDIDSLSAKELKALIAKADQRSKQLAKRKPLAKVKQELAALAKKSGYTLAEIVGGAAAKVEPKLRAPRAGKRSAERRGAKAAGKRAKVAPKYRNPANAEQTWTGRGKPPRWLAAELATGKTLADFLI